MQGAPLGSERDWYLMAAWVLVAIYLYLMYYRPRTAFGLFLLPLALALIATGRFVAKDEPLALGPAAQTWGPPSALQAWKSRGRNSFSI